MQNNKNVLRGCVYLGGRFNPDRQESELIIYLHADLQCEEHTQYHKSEISKHIRLIASVGNNMEDNNNNRSRPVSESGKHG